MVDDKPEHLERKSSDRREQSDRRCTVAPWTGKERRQGNRRQAIDRRGLPFGVYYKSSEPLAILYDWLRDHCYGKWSVGIEAAGNDPFKKAVKVLFELESDKDTFMTSVVRA
ncbi:MAG: hypothetical protein HOL66_09650 [Rhodospirillaceae bacterium]|jgi:hypothetical protein|nr:hypothetical protein [Rhodospirillaceae bacterium]MBT5244500.1 hypothetical protein [Rhodospirillaceae bacterium]MBT5560757.1 hypothetical protein [Rhodospirillaceae bacterium]MBT6241596.1 hypothetical protein [Rhodospirillaceae bacterium]MBT7136382.1 hypothetical protein [Rhodospirillaceae bacterium]